jgi:hypothetical protein
MKTIDQRAAGQSSVLRCAIAASRPTPTARQQRPSRGAPPGRPREVDPYSNRVTLMKTKPTSPNSPREKIPFEVTPLVPYLTRYVETSAAAADHDAAMALK